MSVLDDYIHKDALRAYEPVVACCYEIAQNGSEVDKVLAQTALDRMWARMREQFGASDDSQGNAGSFGTSAAATRNVGSDGERGAEQEGTDV